MEKKGAEDPSRAADPALEQGRAAGEDAEKEPSPETDETDETSEDSFPTSDAPSW